MDAQFLTCEESITFWEAKVHAEHGSAVLAVLQALAKMRHWTCEEFVDACKNAALFVAMNDAVPSGDGRTLKDFLTDHPGRDASAEDIAEYRAEKREQARRRAMEGIDLDDEGSM